MNRRQFLASTAALTATSLYPSLAQTPDLIHGFPPSMLRDVDYIECCVSAFTAVECAARTIG